MSVCEGCPCDLQPYVETADEGTCALGVKFQKDEFHYSIRPSNCPYAPILKLLVEADAVLPRIDTSVVTDEYADKGMMHLGSTGVLEIKFWIRRKP